MSDRPAAIRHPLLVWILGVVVLGPLILALLSGGTEMGSTPVEVVATVAFLLVGPVYGVTGALIVSRQPRNSVGWMLVAIAVGMSIALVADALTPAQAPESVSVWLVVVVGLASVSWVFFIFPIFHLLLTFPDGTLLSRRWRVLVGLEALMVGFMLFSAPFAESVTSPDDGWSIANPIGFIPQSFYNGTFDRVWGLGLLTLTVSSFLAVVLRFIRSKGVERQQMKVLLFAVSFYALVYGGAAAVSDDNMPIVNFLLPFGLVGIGLAIAVAVLRYRLYDIDRIISRTVSYVMVVGVLGALFVVLVVAVPNLVIGTGSAPPLAVAAATLLVAALFNPLRRRVVRMVDRRFNRARYDSERVMDEFARSLRDQVDERAVLDGWRGVVCETMQPAAIGVWLR